jgi:hypothetical protein
MIDDKIDILETSACVKTIIVDEWRPSVINDDVLFELIDRL